MRKSKRRGESREVFLTRDKLQQSPEERLLGKHNTLCSSLERIKVEMKHFLKIHFGNKSNMKHISLNGNYET